MSKLSRKAVWWGLGIALLVLAGPAGRAAAQPFQKYGYACSVQLIPSASLLGQHGSLSLKLTAEPHCAGAEVVTVVACTTGGQGARLCDPSKDASGAYQYLYDEGQLLALYESLVVAERDQFQISVLVDSYDRLRWVSFFAGGYVASN
jgi:hypothetical protein